MLSTGKNSRTVIFCLNMLVSSGEPGFARCFIKRHSCEECLLKIRVKPYFYMTSGEMVIRLVSDHANVNLRVDTPVNAMLSAALLAVGTATR